MEFIKNFPFITIVFSLFCAIVCFAFKDKKARFVSYFLLIMSGVMSASVLFYNLFSETHYFVYRMGHYDAPIGNEISAGLLEPAFILLFEVVMLLSLMGGSHRIMKDVAERANLDVSTVSRVSNSKYVQTNFGIYPLRFFFNDGYTTEGGEELSVIEIKRFLKECVDNENKEDPYTDDELTRMLGEKGYPIARRTVAKYRQQLNIPTARLRR